MLFLPSRREAATPALPPPGPVTLGRLLKLSGLPCGICKVMMKPRVPGWLSGTDEKAPMRRTASACWPRPYGCSCVRARPVRPGQK